MEFYFNDDESGIGNATSIPFIIENNTTIAEDSLLLDDLNLEQGRHAILARTQDETGRWSLTNYLPFDLCLEEGVIVGEFDVSINGREVTVTDNSLYAEDYQWNMGNNTFIFENQFTYTYPTGSDSTYTITQTVTNFCDSESFSREIVIEATKIIVDFETFFIDEDSELQILIDNLDNIFEPFNAEEELTFIIIDDPKSASLELEITESESVLITPKPNKFGKENPAKIGAIDNLGDTVIATINVVINGVNDAPTVESPFEDVTFCEDCGSFLIENNLNTRFSDIDQDTLSYSVSSENVLTEVIDNKQLWVHLPDNYNGVDNVTITASDGRLFVSENFLVTVSQVPDPIIIIAPVTDKIIDEDETLNLGNIKDVFYSPDGGDVDYQFFSMNQNLGVSLSEEYEMIISLDENYFGEAVVSIAATSGSEKAINEFNLTIISVNDPPTLEDLADFTFCPSQSNNQIFFSGSLRDPDNSATEIVYSSKVLFTSSEEVNIEDLNIIIDNEQGIANFTSSFQDNVTYTVEFTATDPSNDSSSDTILVNLSGISFTQEGDLLTASEADSYKWYLNRNVIKDATSQSYLAVRDGEYFVTAIVNGCEVTSRIDTISITSLEEDILNKSVKIFPNPTTGDFKVIINNNLIKGDIIISIYNAEGKKIKSQTFTKNLKLFEREFQLDGFQRGFYLLVIQSQNARILKPILIN